MKVPEMFKLPDMCLPRGWKEFVEWCIFAIVVAGWLVITLKIINKIWD